jgi:ATP-dependent exoDNAse (exonuclease V) beta subunit
VNAVFPHVLGARSDPWRGVVAFAEATPMQPALRGSAASIEAFTDANSEAAAVVEHVQASLSAGAKDIAVLVRARAHLDAVLPALRAAQIPFAAVDLDVLAQRQPVQDLLSLTHALAQPTDRLAWLSVLRAPWCGITLPDLFLLVAAAAQLGKGSLAPTLPIIDSISGLSDDGRRRLERTTRALVPALASRGCATLANRVRGTWLALGGPACAEDAVDLNAAERFFAVLADHEIAGDIADWSAFLAALATLPAEPVVAAGSRVQVMTLHRAKGLQFDTVIVPGLARTPNRDTSQLLRWRRRPQGLLLAPMNKRGGDDDPIYRYLCDLAFDEEDAELGRLLYVGCTRARERLHLLAVLEPTQGAAGLEWKPPTSGTALTKLWPALRGDIAPPVANVASAIDASPPPVLLSRLPLGWTSSPSRSNLQMSPQTEVVVVREAPLFDWARETARHVGTVAHRLFAHIAADGLDAWTAARVTEMRSRIRTELRAEGIDEAGLDTASQQVETAIQQLLNDDRGRWLFASDHIDARSEWALAGVDGDEIVHIVIDRTFVADGVRWIVDFKTGTHEGADSEAFLDRERIRYEPQLDRYARIVRALDPRPIRLGLYYPLQGGWREWEHSDDD